MDEEEIAAYLEQTQDAASNSYGSKLQLKQQKADKAADYARFKDSISKVNAFLSGKEGGSRFDKLSKVIGPEYTTRFTALLKAVPALDDAVINGGGANTSKILGNFYALLTGAKRVTEGQGVSYRASQAGYIREFAAIVGNGSYRTIAKAITNQKYADWLWNINRPFADGVASIPAQQAIIMLNDKRLIEEQARLRSKSNLPAPRQQ